VTRPIPSVARVSGPGRRFLPGYGGDAALLPPLATERVADEGAADHIRNALQILNGLGYLLNEIAQGGERPEAARLARDSAEGLEHRLTAALAQLTRENGAG
jgi:hypothetical protein